MVRNGEETEPRRAEQRRGEQEEAKESLPEQGNLREQRGRESRDWEEAGTEKRLRNWEEAGTGSEGFLAGTRNPSEQRRLGCLRLGTEKRLQTWRAVTCLRHTRSHDMLRGRNREAGEDRIITDRIVKDETE
jgi:hypothetical protein